MKSLANNSLGYSPVGRRPIGSALADKPVERRREIRLRFNCYILTTLLPPLTIGTDQVTERGRKHAG
jgi:chorismate-pyruvate lyase